MDLTSLNLIAVLVASLLSFVIGALWYSPFLFGSLWMKENGFTSEDLEGSRMGPTMAGAFVLSLVIAFNLAAFLHGPPDLVWGMIAGGLAGIGWVATSIGITYLFERKSFKLFLVNAGYHAVNFIAMGALLGVWK